MRTWTAHLHPARPPTLVAEGFSTAAFLFGPLWLAANRAWLAAVLGAAVSVLAIVLTPVPLRPVTTLVSALAYGVFGRDLVRWSLDLRGYVLANVVAARDEDAALARLLGARPDQMERLAP